ncbi:MAG: HDOD domain-containing protein [Syntrophobacteraceae bacterium]
MKSRANTVASSAATGRFMENETPGEAGKASYSVSGDGSARGKGPPPAPGVSSAERIARVIGDLPAMPHIAAQLLDKLSCEDTSPREINQLITKDQALAARVLKLANSPFYGASRSIATLNDALLFMGFDSIRSLILTTVLKSMYSRVGLAEKLFWEHSVGCGLAARKIADEVRYLRRDEAYLAGLMHDVGKAALFWHAPGLMREVIRDVLNDGLDFLEAEQRRFGFTHAQIGGSVAHAWCFVASIEEAIAGHHHTEQSGSTLELTHLVSAADSICHKLSVGPIRKPDLDLNEVKSIKALGLTPDRVAKILEASEKELTPAAADI